MAGKLRRPGEPQPPRTMTDDQLASARPDQIAKRIREPSRFAEHLEGRPDPGRGLPPGQAREERERHLAQLEKQVGEIERLAKVLAPLSAAERKRLSPKTLFFNKKAIVNAPRSEEEKRALKEMYDGLAAQETEREAKRKLRDLKERRLRPPDPKASSVLASVISSVWLRDATNKRNRDDVYLVQDGRRVHVPKGEFVSARLLEPSDLPVLVIASYAIETGPGVLNATAPGGYGLSELPDVRTSLTNLHRAGLLEVVKEADRRWRVSWGKRALRIAKEAGVELPPTAGKREAEPVPASA